MNSNQVSFICVFTAVISIVAMLVCTEAPSDHGASRLLTPLGIIAAGSIIALAISAKKS
jgi:hypothetical protein